MVFFFDIEWFQVHEVFYTVGQDSHGPLFGFCPYVLSPLLSFTLLTQHVHNSNVANVSLFSVIHQHFQLKL